MSTIRYLEKLLMYKSLHFLKNKNLHRFLSSNFLNIFYVFIFSRVIVLLFGYLGNIFYTAPRNLTDAFCQWDCGWYLSVIKNGYDIVPHGHSSGDAANWAFFPLFPKIVALINYVFSINPISVALVMNNIAFFFGLYFLFLYTKKEFNEKIALTTITLMAFSPYSIYFSAPYTESLFFLLLIVVFYLITEEKWIYVGLFAALLSGTRATGVLIVFPMLIIAINQFGFKNLIMFRTINSYKVFLSILMAPFGLFMYMYYLYLKVGDALAFKHIQIVWRRENQNPLKILYNGFLAPLGSAKFTLALLTLLGIFLTFVLLYKKRYPEFIFMCLIILIPLLSSLDSMPRYIFSLFPMYIALSLIIYKYDTLKQYLLLFFSVALAFITIFWVTGQHFMI